MVILCICECDCWFVRLFIVFVLGNEREWLMMIKQLGKVKRRRQVLLLLLLGMKRRSSARDSFQEFGMEFLGYTAMILRRGFNIFLKRKLLLLLEWLGDRDPGGGCRGILLYFLFYLRSAIYRFFYIIMVNV